MVPDERSLVLSPIVCRCAVAETALAVTQEALAAGVEEVRSDEPDLASYLRIEERELEAGGQN
jgi:hypothetical protein